MFLTTHFLTLTVIENRETACRKSCDSKTFPSFYWLETSHNRTNQIELSFPFFTGSFSQNTTKQALKKIVVNSALWHPLNECYEWLIKIRHMKTNKMKANILPQNFKQFSPFLSS